MAIQAKRNVRPGPLATKPKLGLGAGGAGPQAVRPGGLAKPRLGSGHSKPKLGLGAGGAGPQPDRPTGPAKPRLGSGHNRPKQTVKKRKYRKPHNPNMRQE